MASRRGKSLVDIVAYIKGRLGIDVVSLGVSDPTITEYVKDALSTISEYKPKVVAKTIAVGARRGVVQVTEMVIPQGWTSADGDPTPVPMENVIGFLNIEQANRSGGNYSEITGDPFHYMYNPIMMSQQHDSPRTIVDFYSDYIDFTLISMTHGAIMSSSGNNFFWEEDPNDPSRAFFDHLPEGCNSMTIEVGVEHNLDPYYRKPTGAEPDVAVLVTPVLNGQILELVQKLALGVTMQTEGRIRHKLEGGNNTTQMDGADLIGEGKTMQEEVETLLKENPDLWGWNNQL